jgi:hypothetical protein
MLVYRGETRFLAVELAAVMAEGDELAAITSVEIVRRRGNAASDLLSNSPAPPAIDGTEVQFWVEIPDDNQRSWYLVVVTCSTMNGEVIVEKAPLVVK